MESEKSDSFHFCSECAHCGATPWRGDHVKRWCAASGERKQAHLKTYGYTPDAYWTAPDEWTYINSCLNPVCKWFKPK